MLRLNGLIGLLFCCPFLALTQTYSINWGPENAKEGGLNANFRLVGLTDDAYHLIMRPRRSNTLLSFNFDHRLISNKAINFQFDSKNRGFRSIEAGTHSIGGDINR